MEVKLNNTDDIITDIKIITIIVNDVEFRLSVNNFNQLVVNKQQYGEGESSIVIMPSVSNEIRIL
jgi:hypothetical protein